MKVLITGATGFVGSHLVDLLLKYDFEISCMIRKSSNIKWLETKKVKYVYGNLEDKSSFEESIKDFDIVYHIAGRTFGRSFNEFYNANCIGTKNLIEVVAEKIPHLKRFVYLSSQTAAGPSPSFEHPIDEYATPKPITSYGKSKYAAEKEVMKHKGKIPFTILRPPAIYGPRDTAILPVFQSVKFSIGTLIGFDKKYISLLHVGDVVRGIYEASVTDKTIDNTYFITSCDFYSWHEIISIIKNLLNKKFVMFIKIPDSMVLSLAWLSEFIGKIRGKSPVFNYEKGIDFIQQYWTCSHNKALEDFNFIQKIKPEEGFKDTIQWYKQHKWL